MDAFNPNPHLGQGRYQRLNGALLHARCAGEKVIPFPQAGGGYQQTHGCPRITQMDRIGGRTKPPAATVHFKRGAAFAHLDAHPAKRFERKVRVLASQGIDNDATPLGHGRGD